MRVFTDPTNGHTCCDKLSPYPLEDSSENTGPTDSQWRTFFHHPEKCEPGQTWLRNHLPKYETRVVGGYRGLDILVLYFEHSLAVGVLVTIACACITCFALCWAVRNSDISGGFAIGAYIIGLIALIAALYIRNESVGRYSQSWDRQANLLDDYLFYLFNAFSNVVSIVTEWQYLYNDINFTLNYYILLSLWHEDRMKS